MIEKVSNLHLNFVNVKAQAVRKPRQELASIIEFDADAILQYLIVVKTIPNISLFRKFKYLILVQVFEEDFKDKWELMTNPKFHSFVWCLLVAFEGYLTQFPKTKYFSTMRLRPVFMNFMSKYSPAVVRLLMNPESLMGSREFPLLVSIYRQRIAVILICKDLTKYFFRGCSLKCRTKYCVDYWNIKMSIPLI